MHRPIRALGLARRQAALADERRLLIARDPPDRQTIGQVIQAARHTEIARARADFGQYLGWNPE